jgi:hypothetical protein
MKIVIKRNKAIYRTYSTDAAEMYLTQTLFNGQAADTNLWNLNIRIIGQSPANLFRNTEAGCQNMLSRIAEAEKRGENVFEIDWGGN